MVWLRGSGSGFLSEVAIRCQLVLQSWTGWQVAVSHGWQAGTGCWLEASVFLPLGLSVGLLECLHGVVAVFPQSELSRRPRCIILQSLLDLTWEVTLAKE